jgi:predicted glutamine amidotransferase
MCRIFGFRSVLFSKVHSSLVRAENALMGQSKRHPDGWGLAYYVAETPHVVKSTVRAESDDLFHHLSGIVTSQTVLAHIRKATQGKLSLINTHPFQYGKWTFAHNGNIRNFSHHRTNLSDLLSPELGNFILGDTDSELLFYILLSSISKRVSLHGPSPAINEVVQGIQDAVTAITAIAGELSVKDSGIPTENYLTFVLTNGPLMVGFNGGMKLYHSTSKKQCSERLLCASFNASCEAVADHHAVVNHLILSSEPLQGENVWLELAPGEIVGVDSTMRLHRSKIHATFVTEGALKDA